MATNPIEAVQQLVQEHRAAVQERDELYEEVYNAVILVDELQDANDELQGTIDELRSKLGNTRRSRTLLRSSTIRNREVTEIETHAKELYKSILNAWISSPVTGRPTRASALNQAHIMWGQWSNKTRKPHDAKQLIFDSLVEKLGELLNGDLTDDEMDQIW